MRDTDYGREGKSITEELLDILEERRLDLLLLPGSYTWQSRGQETTLDLVFATEGVGQRVIECKAQLSFDYDSDHFHVATILEPHWTGVEHAKTTGGKRISGR
jgi:hypothetical protein